MLTIITKKSKGKEVIKMNEDIIVTTGDIEVYVETQTDVSGTERLSEYSDAVREATSSDCNRKDI